MGVFLKKSHIRSRHDQLGLNIDKLMHQNDAVSVDMLVKDWNRRGDLSPVRYYKTIKQSDENTLEHEDSHFKSEDFLLVFQTEEMANMMVENPRTLCMDGTHGITGYGYYLLTLMVIDKNGQGLCVAWGLSSRENETTWQLVGKSLRPQCHKLKPKVGMADLAMHSYNGMHVVFPSLEFHLWCWWHIDQSVQRHCHGNLCKVKVLNVHLICAYQMSIRLVI